jgi:hypothetical protein
MQKKETPGNGTEGITIYRKGIFLTLGVEMEK